MASIYLYNIYIVWTRKMCGVSREFGLICYGANDCTAIRYQQGASKHREQGDIKSYKCDSTAGAFFTIRQQVCLCALIVY